MGSRVPEALLRIESREAAVAVVGVGYVGLPLAVEIARAGFAVTGVDLDSERVEALSSGRSYVRDVKDSVLAPLVESGRLTATTDLSTLGRMDAISICVPTPLNKTKDPDVSHVVGVAGALKEALRPGQLVVLESTTYPGFTREVFLPILGESGLTVGEDFFLAFSPERVDPGNNQWNIRNTPKIVGGITSDCVQVASALYDAFVEHVVPVSSTDSAELVKLLENTFRAVNIALVNEISLMCRRLGLDTWEVIDAAATKPFGFMPFYPGPGLGGHCIPVDPLYLSWKLKTLKYNARFIELAGEINSAMPEVIARMVAEALNERGQAVKGSRVLLLGVAYKRGVDDLRESPALDLIEILVAQGAQVIYHDPLVATLEVGNWTAESRPLAASLDECDCAVVITDHHEIDWNLVAAEAAAVVDTRNALRGLDVRGRLWKI